MRWLVRAPIWVFRARLGAVFGGRLLLLEHVGRVSHTRRHVVLEVVDRLPDASYVVASGFGTQAQWFRNILAKPNVQIRTGISAPRPATARVMTEEEASRTLERYALRHPRAWRLVKPVLEEMLGAAISLDGEHPPLIALTHAPQREPDTRATARATSRGGPVRWVPGY